VSADNPVLRAGHHDDGTFRGPIGPGPVVLSALFDVNGHPMPQAAEVRWRSDLEGDLGAGFDITPDLRAGRHEISVSGPDGIGGTFQDRAIIIVGG